jgi:hypothetical protein
MVSGIDKLNDQRKLATGRISCPSFVPLTRQKAGQGEQPVVAKLLICMAPSVALLTIYDMCKAADRGMTMTGVRLLEKMGGKSGHWTA